MSDRLNLDFGHNEISHDTTDDYYTPPFIFEALGLTFDIDVCSPPGGAPWIPAKRYLSIIDDGLITSWLGRVWMNPPYSKPAPWVSKWLSHGNGLGLVPMAKSQWFNTLWESEAVAAIAMPIRTKFMKPDGRSMPIFMPCVLIGVGEENIEAMRLSGLGRVR